MSFPSSLESKRGKSYSDPIDDSEKVVGDDNSISSEPLHCMYDPKPSPIKLFATMQDEALRVEMGKVATAAERHWSSVHCWTFREILGVDGSLHEPINWILLTTYLVNFDFLLEEIPELLSIPNVLVVYQGADVPTTRWKHYAGDAVDFLERNPRLPPGTTNNPLKVSMPWGCHHTKMCLVGYASRRLRVIVHTSNLRWADVHLKTQGAFIQDFRQKPVNSQGSISDFESTLTNYIISYRYEKKRAWWKSSASYSTPCTLVELLQNYDFSTAKGVLIPSIPGNHRQKVREDSQMMGYLKVAHAIRKLGNTNNAAEPPSGTSPPGVAPWFTARGRQNKPAIVCQFSSIGSLSIPYLTKFESSWNYYNTNEDPTNDIKPPGLQQRHLTKRLKRDTGKLMKSSLLELVYPTEAEILTSVEGISGGGSVPGRQRNLSKPFLHELLRKWAWTRNPEMEVLMRGKNVPHIKTYYQIDEKDGASMLWFVLTSHNMSKAAWGEVKNFSHGERLVVMHWEMGVFVSPETLGCLKLRPLTNGKEGDLQLKATTISIPIPYPFRPERYDGDDEPWCVDKE